MRIKSSIDLCNTLGYALLKKIDFTRKEYIIMTPLKEEEIKKVKTKII